VRDQQRKRVVVRRPLVDEMDVETVDLGGELVEPVQGASLVRQSYSPAQ